MKVLDCLLNWKDEFLVPYAQNLRNLVSPKTLRDELTRWSLSRDSHFVSEQHRDSLVPLVIRLLVPKVRNLKTLASRKVCFVHQFNGRITFFTTPIIYENYFTCKLSIYLVSFKQTVAKNLPNDKKD